VGIAPVGEARPGAQVLAQLVEALLDLRPDGPVAMPAIAELVDSRSLAAADAVLENVWETSGRAPELRLGRVVPPREDRLRPGGSGRFRFLRDGRHDGGALVFRGFRRDLELHNDAG
jgi:hypothetical protein